MKTVLTTAIAPDMVTEKDILSHRGRLLVPAHTKLTTPYIQRILFYEIEEITIETDAAEDAAAEEAIKEEKTRIRNQERLQTKLKKTAESNKFHLDYSICLHNLKKTFDSIVAQNADFNIEQLSGTVKSLLADSRRASDLFDLLHSMKSTDDSIYAHSMNVAILSNIFGKWLSLSEKDLDTLIVSALLHDIGKTMIPADLLNKPGKYTDEEFILVKQHPQFGHNLLKALPNLDPHVKRSALMHHERNDGSGYPMGLTGDETDSFAQIIAIADVYDAMTTARSYREPLCPFQVIDAFEKEGLQKYNPKFILPLLKQIVATYQNNRILLNDGRGGSIVLINPQNLSRPIVQLSDNTCVDLSAQTELYIRVVL